MFYRDDTIYCDVQMSKKTPRLEFSFPNNSNAFQFIVGVIKNVETELDQDIPVLAEALTQQDWDEVACLAKRHRIEAQVGATVAMLSNDIVPEHIRSNFSKIYRKNVFYGMQLRAEIHGLSKKLSEAKLDHILLKGPAVSSRFYKDPNQRTEIDIDFWIDQQDFLKTRELLFSSGYRQLYPEFIEQERCVGMLKSVQNSVTFGHPDIKICVDLHWRMHRNQALLDLDFKHEMSSASIMSIAGRDVKILSQVAHIHYLICHGAKHAWFRMKWLADLQRICAVMTDKEEQALYDMSVQHGTLRMIGTSLVLLEAVLGDQIADINLDRWRPYADKPLLKYISSQLLSANGYTASHTVSWMHKARGPLFFWRLKRGFSYKSRVVYMTLVKVHHIDILQLSAHWKWAYCIMGLWFEFARVFMKRN